MKKKKRQPQKRETRGGLAPKPQAAPPLDLTILDAATISLRDYQSVQFIQVGAGGNGSHLAHHVARLMRVLYEMGHGVHLTICDPDVVGHENIGRQNFCDAELGLPKAETLARRLIHAFGLNASYYVGTYDESLIVGAELTVLLGCVDKPEGRRAMHQTLRYNDEPLKRGAPSVWWLDLGNDVDVGRVLLGNAYGYESLRGAFPSPRECVLLPSPALQYQDLLRPRREDDDAAEMSCAELLAANHQSLTINASLAAEAAKFLARLFITGDLKYFAWETNHAAGTARATYATPDEVARSIGKTAGYLAAPRADDGVHMMDPGLLAAAGLV